MSIIKQKVPPKLTVFLTKLKLVIFSILCKWDNWIIKTVLLFFIK